MVSLFENCDDSCGWVAALIAAVSYGTFGVPIKETTHIDVHPLVLQSYKSGTMFLLSWFVSAMGVDISFTPWGILSGLLWVLGGSGGIYAIRMAGMAIAVGTWASVMIGVNFVWGILIFKEPVSDIFGTFGAFCMLTIGLIGMSRYSVPVPDNEAPQEMAVQLLRNKPMSHTALDNVDGESSLPQTSRLSKRNKNQTCDIEGDDPLLQREENDTEEIYNASKNKCSALESSDVTNDARSVNRSEKVVLLGLPMTKRQAGIVGAVFNGLMAGSSLIPLHYAKENGYGGANYMISLATGAMLSNLIVWLVFIAFRWMQHSSNDLPGSIGVQVYTNLPSFHFRQIWHLGLIAGCLLTVAMFGSILATTYLGQGVGNSIVQSKILISGLWGIFYYKEISGCERISKWFVAAGFTVFGIVWLSYERISAKSH